MGYQIELLEQVAQPTLTVRRRGALEDLPGVLGQAFGEVMAYVSSLGASIPGPACVVHHSMDMSNLDMEIGFLTGKQLPAGSSVKSREIPAGRYVTCLYKGPYSDMSPLYDAMNAWIAENRLQSEDIAYEFYYNSPMEVPESDLLTRVLMPVR